MSKALIIRITAHAIGDVFLITNEKLYKAITTNILASKFEV